MRNAVWGLAEEGGKGGETIMRVNFRPRRRLVTRKSDLVEERKERGSLTTMAAARLGGGSVLSSLSRGRVTRTVGL